MFKLYQYVYGRIKVSLQDCCKITSGEFVKKSNQLSDGIYPVYNGGTTNTGYYNKYNTDKNKVIVSARGSAGFVNYVDKPFWAGNSCHILNITSNGLNDRFLYYTMMVKMNNIISTRREGTIPSVSQEQLNKINIFIPPLSEQQRIVSILDKFDTICNDTQNGLLKEIDMRKNQFEYYRNKLLTFKEG